MPPILISILLLLFAAAFFLLMVLRVQLSDSRFITKKRRNTRKYICLHPDWRVKGMFEWLVGPPNVQRVLANLPAELEELDVGETDIVSFPAPLPAGLKKLSARDCRSLEVVDALPDSIEVLDFWGCEKLAQLPTSLPTALKELWVVSTALTALPKLPAGLEQLDARCSKQLADLHSEWPEFRPKHYLHSGSLHWLNLCGTPAAKTIAGNLPEDVLQRIKEKGAAGWRFNTIAGDYQYAGEPMPRPVFL
ncbi:hypothetical protein KBF38_15965 [bacterium]|jgi:hypothetical protein|nr:hypothetical protein [bacterium]